MEVFNSKDKFDIFNEIFSPETFPGDLGSPSSTQPDPFQESTDMSVDMGIQRKQRSTLQKLLESQPGKDALGKAPQTRLPTPPPTQPF